MVTSCCVFLCSNSIKNSPNTSFYRFPKVNPRLKKEDQELLHTRRETWLARLKRENVTRNQLNSLRICSKHFISGKPTNYQDVNNPDWAPSINMGYKKSGISPFSKMKKFHRSVNRQSAKRLNLDLSEQDIDVPSSSTDDLIYEYILEDKTDTAVQTDLTSSLVSALESELIERNHELYKLRKEIDELKWSNESCLEDDNKCKFFTGLPSVKLIKLLQTRIDDALSSIRVNNLNNFQKLLLTLMKLRHNTTFRGLAYRFNTRADQVGICFKKVVVLLEYAFRFLLHWPDRDCLRMVMPECFMKTFGESVAVVIDCFEITTQRPSNVRAKAETFSSFNHNYTIKYLIGITPQGVVSFVSDGYGGRTSDRYITEQCGLLDNLLPGDIVLADRGFTVHELVSVQHAELKTPQLPLQDQKQLHPKDIVATGQIASVRVHVERVIGNLRNKFKVLNGPIPLNFCRYKYEDKILMDYIVRVCCILVNLCDPCREHITLLELLELPS